MKRKISMKDKSVSEVKFKKELLGGGNDHLEVEDEAGWESFPASDPPSWSSGRSEIERNQDKKKAKR